MARIFSALPRHYEEINTSSFCAVVTTIANLMPDLKEMGWGGLDWTDMAQNRDLLRALEVEVEVEVLHD
jgi:hypothetical protein